MEFWLLVVIGILLIVIFVYKTISHTKNCKRNRDSIC